MTERRYLTIAYCDLVGSTALSESVDPEELQVLLSQYQQRCTSIVYCHGGYVVNLTGDGLLIDFGYPTSVIPSFEDCATNSMGCDDGAEFYNPLILRHSSGR